jgi:hypothetical protein
MRLAQSIDWLEIISVIVVLISLIVVVYGTYLMASHVS